MGSFEKDIAKCALFLDYDGTLCPHMEVWEGVAYNTHDISEALSKAAQKSSALFWNTGRRVESLGSVSEDFLKYPGFFVQGSIYSDKAHNKLVQIGESFPQKIVEQLTQAIQEHQARYRLEIKPTAARLASFQKTQRKYLKKFVDSLNIEIPDSWEWRIGDRGAELLLKSCSKGSALEYAYKNKLVDPQSIPVAAGDDFLDRSAIEYALNNGGYAVLVGETCGWITEIPHRTSQVVYFREPSDFLRFLRAL